MDFIVALVFAWFILNTIGENVKHFNCFYICISIYEIDIFKYLSSTRINLGGSAVPFFLYLTV